MPAGGAAAPGVEEVQLDVVDQEFVIVDVTYAVSVTVITFIFPRRSLRWP